VDSKGRKILVLEQIPSELADGMGAGGTFKSALLAFLFISPPRPCVIRANACLLRETRV
jgi:hypothetical protein